ncbi:U-scoloptoxin(01)-Cw1a-like 13 [Homarus americanus]|uniref:U-scoloptoxin(01)-Cw1a-like 13 n=1 Tax=Homarus americanus TaxID=6706 RepID=A0A8J5MMZ0_HOMAM|nr:U-scoloptoxin(01)-Cw1a-like 13 [Homarus americanus]
MFGVQSFTLFLRTLTTPTSLFPAASMKVVILLALVSVAAARMAYQLSDGFLKILGGNPNTAFSCDNRPYGYYADVANDCRIFHICHPEVDEFTGETIFSQESLTCAHPEEAFPCDQAESLYDISNADFGKIPEPTGNFQ